MMMMWSADHLSKGSCICDDFRERRKPGYLHENTRSIGEINYENPYSHETPHIRLYLVFLNGERHNSLTACVIRALYNLFFV